MDPIWKQNLEREANRHDYGPSQPNEEAKIDQSDPLTKVARATKTPADSDGARGERDDRSHRRHSPQEPPHGANLQQSLSRLTRAPVLPSPP